MLGADSFAVKGVDGWQGAGVLNIVLNGPTHMLVWADELMSCNVALKHGSRYIYNFYSAGMDNAGSFLDRNNSCKSGGNILSRARLLIGIPVFRRLSIVGGVSYNVYTGFSDNPYPLDRLYGYEFSWSMKYARQWPGAFLGVQL